MKNLFAALVIVGIVSTPLRAELKYTTHLEIKKTAAPAQPMNPMIGIMTRSNELLGTSLIGGLRKFYFTSPDASAMLAAAQAVVASLRFICGL